MKMWHFLTLVVFVTTIHFSISDKCNINLEGVVKKWSTRPIGEPLETKEGTNTLPGAYKILITDQNVPILCNSSITNLNTLSELNLSSNGVEEIEPGAFSAVHHLRYLHLKKNKLKQVKAGIFNEDNMIRLWMLRLEENKIELVEETAFDDMPNLRILNLSNNKITAINKEWFKNSPNLRQLNLENNLISSLSENNFKNLQGRHTFDDNLAWLNIDLRYNKISTLDPKAFDGLEELGMLTLDHNDISTLHEDTFRNLRYLKSVSLMFNQIKCLPTQVKDILKADVTYLENNPWNCTCVENVQHQIKSRRLSTKVHVNYDVMKCKIDKMKSAVKDISTEHE